MIYYFLKKILFPVSFYFINSIIAQTLFPGDNIFLYQNKFNPHEIIVQNVNKNKDTLIVISTRIVMLDTSIIQLVIKNKDLKKLILEEDTSNNLKTDSFYLYDTLIIKNQYLSNNQGYMVSSKMSGNVYVSFSGKNCEKYSNIPFDATSNILYRIRVNADSTIGEFYRKPGLMGFQNYYFKNGFWVLDFFEYKNHNLNNYFLVYFNGEFIDIAGFLKEFKELNE